MPSAIIRGTGHYAPETILTNADLERMVDTNNEWIVERTGIRERRVLNGSSGMVTSDMATKAAQQALEKAGMEATELDAIIVATVTPDFRVPSTATVVQLKLGAGRAAVMDIVAACAGFVYGMSIARAFITSGQYKRVLVIGVEYLTSITNYEDRNTCVLFGDAAGAAVFTPSEPGEENRGVLSTFLSGDGQYRELIQVELGGSLAPLTSDTVNNPGRFLSMDGREVFKLAVREMADAAERVLAEAGVSPDDVDMLIPHQANRRIIDALARKMKFDPARIYVNIERYGNTSSASVPVALNEAVEAGLIGEGSLVLSVAFGGGLVWGSALYRL